MKRNPASWKNPCRREDWNRQNRQRACDLLAALLALALILGFSMPTPSAATPVDLDANAAPLFLVPSKSSADISDVYTQYLALELALQTADPSAKVEVFEIQELPIESFEHLVFSDIWVESDWRFGLSLSMALKKNRDGILEPKARPRIERRSDAVVSAILDSTGYHSTSVSSEIHKILGTGSFANERAVALAIEISVNGEQYSYSAIALWVRSTETNETSLRILDPSTTNINEVKSHLEMLAESSSAESAPGMADLDKINQSLVCDEESASYRYPSTTPFGATTSYPGEALWTTNHFDASADTSTEGSALRFRDNQLHVDYCVFCETYEHSFTAYPELRCQCDDRCYNTGEIALTPGVSKDELLSAENHLTTSNIGVTADRSGSLLDEQPWVYGAAAVIMKTCPALFPTCMLTRTGNVNISMNVGASTTELSGAQLKAGLSFSGSTEGTPLSVTVGGRCPPCYRRLNISGKVKGLQPGKEIELWAQWQARGEVGQSAPYLVDTVRQDYPTSDFEIAFSSDYVVGQAPNGVQWELDLYALQPGSGTKEPSCIDANTKFERDNITLDLFCSCDPDANGDGIVTALEKSTCEGGGDNGPFTATAKVEFAGYKGAAPKGSAQITVTGIPASQEEDSVSASVTARPSDDGVLTLPIELQEGWTYEAAVSSQDRDTQCYLTSRPAGLVDADVRVEAQCFEIPSDICELAPIICRRETEEECIDFSYAFTAQLDWACVDKKDPSTCGLTEFYVVVSDKWCYEKALGDAGSGPLVHFRNLPGSTYSENFEVFGVARHPLGLQSLQFFVDHQPVSLQGLQTGLEDSWTCSEVPSASCDSRSGFSGTLDIASLADDVHTLSVYGVSGDGEYGAFSEIEFEVQRSGSPDDTEIVTHTIPPSMNCGDELYATVTVRNTGSTTWDNSQCAGYKLGTVGDSDPFFGGQPKRVAIGSPVAPTTEETFSFLMTAPDVAGTYVTDWRMISQATCGGGGWFGDIAQQSVEVTCSDTDSAEAVSTTVPTSMSCGDSQTVSITMRNDGTTTWTPGDGYELLPGSDNVLATGGAIPVPWNVSPGESVPFTVPIAASANLAGESQAFWRMGRNGQAFGESAGRTVDVQCDNLAEIVSVDIPERMSCGDTYTAQVTMRNLGTDPWNWVDGTGYLLGSDSSEPMRPEAPYWFPIQGGQEAGLGETITWWLPLVAPDEAGVYETKWRMMNLRDGGFWFGPQVRQNVAVSCPSLRFLGPGGAEWGNGSLHHLGSVEVGSNTDWVVRFCNDGPGPLEFLQTILPIFSGSGWEQVSDTPSSVAAGACSYFRVRFLATEAGTFDGTLVANTNELGNTPFGSTLRVEAEEAPRPQIEVSRSSTGRVFSSGETFTFVSTPVSQSISELFRICNVGDLELTLAQTSGLVSGTGFTQVDTEPSPSLAPGACTNFRARFNVLNPGNYSGLATLESNDALASPFLLNLQAEATAAGSPKIEISRASTGRIFAGGETFTFPPTPVSELPISELFRVCNVGDAVLTLPETSGLVSGTGFSQTGTEPASSLAPGACTNFRARFNVLNVGSYSGAATVQSNDAPASPFVILLEGTAAPEGVAVP